MSGVIHTQEGGRPSIDSPLADKVAALIAFDGTVIGRELDPG
jgi:hypothetical protein